MEAKKNANGTGSGPTAVLTVRRVVHASVLLDFGGAKVLTDPWFSQKRGFPAYYWGEPLGIAVADLPGLSGVVSSHGHYDHYDVEAFSAYPDKKVPFVVKRGTGGKARAVGFENVIELDPWETVDIGPVRVTAAPAKHGVPENTYVLEAGRFTVFFGGDTLLIPELTEVAKRFPKIDLAERLDQRLELLVGGARDAPARHKTLRGTLDWSYELLGEPERKLLGRLSVFMGGWDLGAAEAVGAGEGIEESDVLDLLGGLVDKSLVGAAEESGVRYRLLEPVRQYALEKLGESGEEGETRRRHAAFFLGLSERARPELRAARQVEWLEVLERENGNLRAAMAWAIARDVELAARLGWALWAFWNIRNSQREGRRWLEPVLARREGLALRARVLMAAGAMAYRQGDDEVVERYAQELMELSRQLGRDPHVEAYVRTGLGLVATARGEFEAATRHLEESLPLLHESGEEGMAAQAHTRLGMVLLLQGDHDRAGQRFEEGLALGRRTGDRLAICQALFNLAQLVLSRADYDLAARRFSEGIIPSGEMGDRANIAFFLEGLAAVAGARGQDERSTRLFSAAEGVIEVLGVRGTYYYPDSSLYERTVAAARSRLGEEAFEEARAEGRAMVFERAVEYALSEEEQAPLTASAPEYPAGLTSREAEVLGLMAQGLTNAQVAERLYLSPRTVNAHLTSVYHKLGVSSRSAATRFALEHGIV